jgi:hypothetical protein
MFSFIAFAGSLTEPLSKGGGKLKLLSSQMGLY